VASTKIILPHGNYRALLSYQKAEAVFDITFRFCERFLRRGDRTIDQMVQAARSCKQNIIEGSAASGTSKEMELKLIGVARASLDELLGDYHDFLRVRDLPLWAKNSKQALYVRRLSHDPAAPFEAYRPLVADRPADTVANIAICLINQANYLLDRQLKALESDFLKHGGIRERMTRARLEHRRIGGG
jgi:four helix bundle suffix protein